MSKFSMTDCDNQQSFSSKMRTKRIKPLIDLISKVHSTKGMVSILDMGGRKTYWNAIPIEILEKFMVKVTIVNLPAELIGKNDKFFTYIEGDACNLSEYPDNKFDIVHSNSVIEHVGNWAKIKEFARETNRLAKHTFVQTPYFWFPVEPHYVKFFHHWLPRPIRMKLWLNIKIDSANGATSTLDEAMALVEDEPYLLDKKMMSCLFPNCKILEEKFYGLTKSLIAYR